MDGFKKFVEGKTNFFSTMKKQFSIPKKLWMGMPILVSPPAKIGNYKIYQPTFFYVKDFNRDSVTICSMKNNIPYAQEFDIDGEIDLDDEPIEATITRKDFEKLSEPTVPPQSDMGGMMGGMGGGLM